MEINSKNKHHIIHYEIKHYIQASPFSGQEKIAHIGKTWIFFIGHNLGYITINSPGNAFFIIQIYAQEDAVPLQQFAEQFSEFVQQEDTSSMMSDCSLSDFEEEGRYGIQENFSSKALWFQLPHIRRYYSVTDNSKINYLISQFATSDLSEVETGFGLILNALFLKQPHPGSGRVFK